MDGSLLRATDFAIIQTVYALQKLDYLQVVDVWDEIHHSEKDFSSSKGVRFLNVNIILKQPFLDEINQKYREDNPKLYYQGYDNRKKLLKIASKSINLAQKGKDTDGIKLIETLLKDIGPLA